jgi:uncharacterized membrane protein (UPF0127 family)
MARRFLAALLVIGAGLGPWWGPARGEPPAVSFETAALAVTTASGTHRFTVEMAVTPEQRARGLMFRRRLAADHGMLLVYETERDVAIWMKNTYLSLDILFVGGDGRIRHIVERAPPLSTRVMPSGAPVRAVLELPAGTAARLGIRVGDRVRHSVFATGLEEPW